MWPKIAHAGIIACIIVLCINILGTSNLQAQDTQPAAETTETATAEPTAVPTVAPTAIVVSIQGVQPTQFVQGTGGTLVITGENFSTSTSASLDGSIALQITSQTTNRLEATVNNTVPAGDHTVTVTDPIGGTATASNTVTVIAPTTIPQLTITQNEPTQITAGQGGTLSIIGANFSEQTTVRLVGYGFLQVTFINSGALTANLPQGVPAGQYSIELSDPTYGNATTPNPLTVTAASATAAPAATATAITGEPMLVVRNFSAAPASIYPGGVTLLTFEVVNVGTQAAQGVVVSLGNTDFAPANGQAGITLPDLFSYASYVVSLSVIAPSNLNEGPANIPVSLTFRDSNGQNYSDTATLSVNIIEEEARASQIVLDSYLVTPDTAEAGDMVTVQALFVNTGSETAEQVLVQLESGNAVLIAGNEGDSFPVSEMQPGASAAVTMPLVIAAGVEAGFHAQSLSISYMQEGETHQTSASISLNVEQTIEESAMLLLQSYDTGDDESLQPGQEFTFNMHLQNVGGAGVSDLLVTFGQSVSSSSENGGSSSSSSSNFTTLGSGDTVLIGDLPAGETVTLDQDLIVDNSVNSGIYSLPIALQYQLEDGTTETKNLNASLIVIVQPYLRVTLPDTLDDALTAGESYSTQAIEIANMGSSDVALTKARIIGENITISDGEETLMETLQSDDDTSIYVSFSPDEAGSYTFTVELDYIDDLNRTQTFTTAFTGEVEEQRQQQRPETTFTPPTEEEDEGNLVGRLLLGFLGLGG